MKKQGNKKSFKDFEAKPVVECPDCNNDKVNKRLPASLQRQIKSRGAQFFLPYVSAIKVNWHAAEYKWY